MTDKYTQMARGQECLIRIPGVCNFNPETTVLAHYRLVGLSGMGIKSNSICGAWACSSCHTYVDTHRDDTTARAHLEGVLRTLTRLFDKGVIK